MAEEIQNEEEQSQDYAAQLAQIRTLEGVGADIKNLQAEGRAFGHPSYTKYIVLIFLAVANDGVDALQLTGFLAVLSWVISAGLGAIIVLIYWLSNTPQKKANDFVDSLENKIHEVEQKIVRVSAIVEGSGKTMGRVGAKLGSQRLVRAGASLERSFSSLKGFFSNNPVAKAVVGAIGGIVLPVQTFFVIWSYFDERAIYRNAAKSAEETAAQLASRLNEVVSST